MSEAFDVRIITASYRREPVEGPEEPQVPVIQLFGRTREGKSIGVAYREDGEIKTRILTGNEKEIIERFVKLIWELDPDIISGYNIDGYDLPVLVERSAKHGMQRLQLARDHSSFFHLGERFWRLDGRILTDVWWAVRAEMRPKQETLDYVAKHLLGVGKHELQRRKIDEEWEADRDKVIRYCINDAELSLKILERVRRIEKTLDLAAVSKLPLEDVLHGRTSNLIDSILIRAADRAHVAVPMMKMRGGRVEQIEGGYVHSLQPGLYEWVISLDFRAMYPSLIIENNICFTTVSPNGTIASPTGAKFLAADIKKGLLPVILANLMKDRQEVRSRMKAETDPQMKDFYEGLQAAIKILMNAFYGVLASSFYRFNDPKVGASITAFARDRIKGIIGELEAEQVKVVYGETDSVFFQSPSPGPEESLACARKTAERFSRGRISMEVDKIYETLFSHGRKKRYAGKVAWPEEMRNEMVVRGYEIRRTDAFDLQSEAQGRVFEKILDRDQDGSISLAKQIVAEVRAGTPTLDDPDRDPIEALVISRTVKEENRYVNPNSMSNVIAARKLEQLGEEFMPGMKVSWIVTDSKKSPMEVEPILLLDRQIGRAHV